MTTTYTINTATGDITKSDGSHFPQDDSLPAFLEYLDWLQDGNTPGTTSTIASVFTHLRITKLAFRNRFTTTEKVMLEMACLDDPTGSIQSRQLAAALRVYLKDVDNATFIDLSLPETITGVRSLVHFGLLTAARADAILNTPPTSVELYTSSYQSVNLT